MGQLEFACGGPEWFVNLCDFRGVCVRPRASRRIAAQPCEWHLRCAIALRCNVPPWPREIGKEARCYRIANGCHDDGNACRGLPCGRSYSRDLLQRL